MRTGPTTNRTVVSPELQAHLDRILAMPRLDVEQERALMRRYFEEDDAEAGERIIEAHLRFVVAIALKYRNYPISMSDLVSEGTLGLIVALDKFDHERGTRFVTYASFWIRAFVLELVIRSYGTGRLGSGPFRSKIFFRLRREHARIHARYGEASRGLDHVARRMGLSTEAVRDMLVQMESSEVPLDHPLPETHASTPDHGLHGRFQDPEDTVAREHDGRVLAAFVEEALERLDDRERYIVEARLMTDTPRTLASVGASLGVSRERTRQLEGRALHKLKEALGPRLEEVSLARRS
jgi:RNA polymerase sigma-32 factor